MPSRPFLPGPGPLVRETPFAATTFAYNTGTAQGILELCDGSTASFGSPFSAGIDNARFELSDGSVVTFPSPEGIAGQRTLVGAGL